MTSSKRQGQKINSALKLFPVLLLFIHREYFYDIAINTFLSILNGFSLLSVDVWSYADDCIFYDLFKPLFDKKGGIRYGDS